MSVDIRFSPLAEGAPWPETSKRPSSRCNFRASYTTTMNELREELDHLRVREAKIEADYDRGQIRNDGMPRASANKPRTPRVRLSFEQPKVGPITFAQGGFPKFEDNLRAIVLTLKSLRAVNRYGCVEGSEQYRGFAALPPGGSIACGPATKAMSRTDAAYTLLRLAEYPSDLYLVETVELARAVYRDACKIHHPDTGGDPAKFAEVQRCWDVLKEAN